MLAGPNSQPDYSCSSPAHGERTIQFRTLPPPYERSSSVTSTSGAKPSFLSNLPVEVVDDAERFGTPVTKTLSPGANPSRSALASRCGLLQEASAESRCGSFPKKVCSCIEKHRSKRQPAKRCKSSKPLKSGAPEEIRTPDPQIRSLVLYPAELRALASAQGPVPRALSDGGL